VELGDLRGGEIGVHTVRVATGIPAPGGAT
jgi:hypothetical protein